MAHVLGVATIGQAPRDDLAALFAAHAPSGTKVIVRGCLDDLTDEEIAMHKPEDAADTLYSRLRGSYDVKVSKRFATGRAPKVFADLRADGCHALVFACTGDFPPIPGDAGVIFPSRVLNGIASSLLQKGRLGIFVPFVEQSAKLKSKWSRLDLEVTAEALVPSGSASEAADAAKRLKDKQPDLVAMDCMAYSPETKAIVKEILGVPTILAITATGRVINEVLS